VNKAGQKGYACIFDQVPGKWKQEAGEVRILQGCPKAITMNENISAADLHQI
jgi:hypothetical protein